MSIHIILGKPGAGKSRYGTEVVIRQLRDTNRNVVTNLPLKLDRLNEYCNTRYPNENLSPVTRITLLDEESLKCFWKQRGTHSIGAETLAGDGGRGVCYVLDEAHIAFNARDWAILGRDCIHYMSQHRKLGDVVFPITQSVGNLDKQFRSVAEDYTVLRNEYTAKLGIFRGAGRFVRRSYYGEPGRNVEPFETATFSLDASGLASCYDTAQGIGVHGSKADIGRRAKGISIYWVFPMVIATAMLCLGIPWFLGHQAGKFISGKSPAELPKKAEEKPRSGEIFTSVKKSVDLPSPVVPRGAVPPSELPVLPVPIGVVVSGKSFTLHYDDGSMITEQDGIVQEISRGRVKIAGVWHTLKKNKNAIAAPKVEEKGLTPEEIAPESAHGTKTETVQNDGDSETARSERPGESTFASHYYAGTAGSVQNSRSENVTHRPRASDRGRQTQSRNHSSSP